MADSKIRILFERLIRLIKIIERVSHKLGVSEFEIIVDFRSRYASSGFIKTFIYYRLQHLIKNEGFRT